MLLRHIFAMSLSVASAAAWSDTFDINLNNDVAQFQYNLNTGRATQGKSELRFGVLYNDTNSLLGEASLMVANDADKASGISVGVGVKVLTASIGRTGYPKINASAVALGGQLRFSPPAAKAFGIVGEFQFAPRIITFADADSYDQVGLRLEYEVMPQTMAYVGYRKIRFGVRNGGPSAVLDDGAHVGVKLAF